MFAFVFVLEPYCLWGGHLSAVQIGEVDMCRYLLSLLFVCVRVFRVRALAHRKASEPFRRFQGLELTEVLRSRHLI